MEIFMEYIVKHKRTGKDTMIVAGIILLAFILIVISSIMLTVQMLASLWLLVVAGIIYGAVFLIKRTIVEFEYILTNNELDIDKIMAKSSRKRIISVDFKEIEICAPVNSPDHKFEYENTQAITKTYDCIGDGITDIYFIDMNGEGGKVRVLFQPPYKLIESAKKFNPRKIFIA